MRNEQTEEHIEQPLPDEPKEEQSEPMGILTSRAHEDMTLAILQVQAAYGLPAYLTDLIVTAVLADIRGCANKDLLNGCALNCGSIVLSASLAIINIFHWRSYQIIKLKSICAQN